MIISHMSYDMYYGRGEFADKNFQNVRIAAFINAEGVLEIGHNGTSANNQYLTVDASVDEFEFFCNHLYRGASQPMAQFLRNGIPYELMRVANSRQMGGNILYTFLTPCRVDTYFCKCKDCGKNFVIDCYESPHYLANDLTVPTVRCRDCINARKRPNRF